ncbi:DUF2300 domain-containing protein [Ideonella livida]|uniref:DUF2300 domain-containing protein n=1 Tax=Ideonella livida TaxID=2707176 RepID=A0A7C9PH70_9BURK|nr:DUF2300 domain-containing protein [Ideonella livida]NDY91291.1 DUF2300 domain-containing protein [Ideonella livida]
MKTARARIAAAALTVLQGAVGAQALPDQAATRTASAPTLAPLGSLWKLFVHAWLVEQTRTGQPPEPVFTCGPQAERQPDEDYCCEPGGWVERDEALRRSCGPYFEPARLGLSAAAWRAFWSALDPDGGRPATQPPDWLRSLERLRPDTWVPRDDILQALAAVPATARLAAREALGPLVTQDPALAAVLGSSPRYKTWSWVDAQGERLGGAGGWLADGQPFWIQGPGTGRRVVQAQAATLAQAWTAQGRLQADPEPALQQAQPCVQVQFFARHPLASVTRPDGQAVVEGPLAPVPHELRFASGTRLSLTVPGPLQASREVTADGALRWRLSARLPLEDYIARVLDREADPRQTAPTRALAVVARTWLLHHTVPADATQAGCRQVEDSTHAQRVSPLPPSPDALAAARFTAGWVLQGELPHGVRYHLEDEGPGVFGWRPTLARWAASPAQPWTALLAPAFGSAGLGQWGQADDCQALPDAARWLTQRQHRWRERLRHEPGYEPPAGPVQVCALSWGPPHADLRRQRIVLREWHSREGRLTLIHEYLHLAFIHHPRGRDEDYIEALARQLVDR